MKFDHLIYTEEEKILIMSWGPTFLGSCWFKDNLIERILKENKIELKKE